MKEIAEFYLPLIEISAQDIYTIRQIYKVQSFVATRILQSLKPQLSRPIGMPPATALAP
jgi:hypothetical protein